MDDTNSSFKKTNVNASTRLWSALKNAAKDTLKNPARAITTLQTYFDQRAWHQVKNTDERYQIREHFGKILSTAYYKKKNIQKAEQVNYIIEQEKKLFDSKIFN